MTLEEFEKLKEILDKNRSSAWASWQRNYVSVFVKYNSPKSKYRGSILDVNRIEGEKIHATCNISGAPKINPSSHYRNFELTDKKKISYVDATIGIVTIKDFFNDDINVGDYVFGEYNRSVIFGIVRNTKIADGKRRGYSSKINEFDSAMIEIIKIESRDGYKPSPVGENQFLEMKYFIKVEDPTLYLLKL